MAAKWLAIGEVAERTGLSVSAIRYYETQGLVAAVRNAGRQRRFLRADIRRLSFVMIAQRFGFSLERIREVLSGLPNERTPTRDDWNAIATQMRGELDERIAMLTRLRDKLDGCIGCGCMSLDRCQLYNQDDEVGQRGPGPRHILEE